MVSFYSKGTAGIVFTFDCSNRESFKGVEEWIEKAEQHLDVKGLVSVLASTKTDLEKEVGDEEAKNYAKSKKLVNLHNFRLSLVQVPRLEME